MVQEDVFAVYVANPHPKGELPPPLEVDYEAYNEDIGVNLMLHYSALTDTGNRTTAFKPLLRV